MEVGASGAGGTECGTGTSSAVHAQAGVQTGEGGGRRGAVPPEARE